MKKIITTIIATIIIAGCAGGLRGKSNLAQPVELNSAIPNNLVVKVWEAKTKSKTAKESALRFLIADDGVNTLYVAGEKGVVTAIDMSNGAKIWENKVPALHTGVTYSQGVLLVGQQDAHIAGLSASDGQPIWQQKIMGVPAVSPVSNGHIAVVRTLFGAVETFALQTGEVDWAYLFNSSEFFVRGAAAPTFIGNNILAASDEGTLALINGETGEQIWSVVLSKPLNGSFMGGLRDVDAAIIVTPERIFVGQYQTGITALTHQGRKLWQAGKGTYAGIAYFNGDVISISRDSAIEALDAKDGSLVWSNNDLYGRNLTKPVIVGSRIVVGDYDGYVHVLDAASGVLQGSTKISSKGFMLDIKEINGSVYLLDYSGTLYKVSI